jgi:putative photosynthetic complex assembly protein 2
MIEFSTSIPAAVLFALLCWWLGTGVILWLVRLPVASFRLSLPVFSLLFFMGLWGAHTSMDASTPDRAYLGFASVILMWSWHELSFLTGHVTGPRRVALSPDARGWSRFVQALQVLLHHELALLANFLLLLWLQNDQPNHVALCTFALLWCMRFTAKMNLFLGVPEVGDQYLPKHLAYLGSYFKRGPVSGFFYLTMGVSCLTWAWLIWQAHIGMVAATTGWALLATLLGLAIVEHVLMVFHVPMQRLWGWAMSRRQPSSEAILPGSPVAAKPDQA